MERKHEMISTEPAVRWQEAFPAGNGTVGALVPGNLTYERITLNHEALWLHTDKPSVPDISAHLPELRQLLAEGRWQEGDEFLHRHLRDAGYPIVPADPYHPAGDLLLELETSSAFRDYRRHLDFTTGEITVSWRDGDASCERRLFVSRADDVVVMVLRTSEPGRISGRLSLQPHPGHEEAPVSVGTCAEGEWLFLKGCYDRGGEWGVVGRVIGTRGRASTEAGGVRLTGADEALVLCKLFANEASAEALPRLQSELAALPADYATLREPHRALHRGLFLRATVDLDAGADRERSNEDLLAEAYQGAPPTALLERMCDFGRYLLICSSRPGGLPANLQGIWNGDWNPPWGADFHNDENIQMNYWAALPGNLPETTLPYFDLYEASLPDCRENARQVLGCRGIFAPISQSTHALLYPSVWANWTAGAGWLAQLFYDYWLFTGDRQFLAEHALPYLKEVAAFYEDFLVPGPEGKLMFSPSLSPENIPSIPGGSFVTVNATMDVAVAREVLGNLCAACETLGVESDSLPRWRDLLARLPEYEVNEDGAFREWLYPGLRDNYHHRHQSHLYPLFPGFEITRESDPHLFEALRVAVEKRLVIGLTSQTGWSLAHMANIYARLGEGERALECLELLTRSVVLPNLFTCHNDWRAMGLTTDWFAGDPPFQIDANFGLTAAVLEMLVFSRPGLLKLLPALPGKWARGKAQGLLCRGGIEAALTWDLEAGELTATFHSRTEQTVRVVLPPGFAAESGSAVHNLPAGETITLRAKRRA